MNITDTKFFTPIQYEGEKPWMRHIEETVEDYFYLWGKKAYVIPTNASNNSYEVTLENRNQNKVEQIILGALKVISYATVLIPSIMLSVKICFRMSHSFRKDYKFIKQVPSATSTKTSSFQESKPSHVPPPPPPPSFSKQQPLTLKIKKKEQDSSPEKTKTFTEEILSKKLRKVQPRDQEKTQQHIPSMEAISKISLKKTSTTNKKSIDQPSSEPAFTKVKLRKTNTAVETVEQKEDNLQKGLDVHENQQKSLVQAVVPTGNFSPGETKQSFVESGANLGVSKPSFSPFEAGFSEETEKVISAGSSSGTAVVQEHSDENHLTEQSK